MPKIGTTTWKHCLSGASKKAKETYLKVMVARYLLDRLISAYNDKLVESTMQRTSGPL